MARKPKSVVSGPGKRRATEQFPIPPELVDHILLGPADDRRVLQDSPVLGDVWLAYAADPGSIQDLLITPHRDATAAQVAACISKVLASTRVAKLQRGGKPLQSAKVAYLQGIVAAQLTFDELLQVLVPLTQWWAQKTAKQLDDDTADKALERLRKVLDPKRFRAAALEAVGASAREPHSFKNEEAEKLTALDRYVALAGLILWVSSLPDRPQDGRLKPYEDIEDVFERYKGKEAEIFQGVFSLYKKSPSTIAPPGRKPASRRTEIPMAPGR